METEEQPASKFKIGAVARLTGIPVETLRVWERRYDVVAPHRTSGGNRLFDQQDVARLMVIKRLVDSGNAISTIAQLSLDQLSQRESHAPVSLDAQSAMKPSPSRIAIIGSSLSIKLKNTLAPGYSDRIEIVRSLDNIGDIEKAADIESLDGLIIEVPTLLENSAIPLRRLQSSHPDTRVIVVYGFGKRKLIKQLESLNIIPLQQPVGWPELTKVLSASQAAIPTHSVAASHAGIMEAPIPGRQFDDNQLAKIAQVTTNVDCECPHHVTNLLLSLNNFELYSAECESLSDEDTAVHAYLHRATAQARSLMESALQLVLETDGIDISAAPTRNGKSTY